MSPSIVVTGNASLLLKLQYWILVKNTVFFKSEHTPKIPYLTDINRKLFIFQVKKNANSTLGISVPL